MTTNSSQAATQDQPKPKPNESTPIWDLVLADIRDRDAVGRARYGTPLQAFNGRDPLVDAYQEALDKVVYLRQEIEERRVRGELSESAIRMPALDNGCIRISPDDLRGLLNDVRLLNVQLSELHIANNALVEARRTTLRARVREFFAVADQHIAPGLTIPDDKTVRFRVRLVGEESLELVKASIADRWKDGVCSSMSPHATLAWLHDGLMQLLLDAQIDVNLPEFADACADIDYVVEGARVAFGIDGEPIMAEVHKANLAKAGGPVRESDGKRMKPPGWTPPDIEGELRKQGYKP